MNERIKEIGRTAGLVFIGDGVYGDRWYSSKCGIDASEFEKFAKLIVAECIKYCGENLSETVAGALKIHFGEEQCQDLNQR